MLWKKGERVLTAGPIHVRKDFRLNLVEANSLKIENVHVSDTGINWLIDSVCNIRLFVKVYIKFFKFLITFIP